MTCICPSPNHVTRIIANGRNIFSLILAGMVGVAGVWLMRLAAFLEKIFEVPGTPGTPLSQKISKFGLLATCFLPA